ncbi:hypothetical protein ANRL4_04188 [Anaerolineae bacterium]|nr:hypothetical protein ANRL4_04188 [Anaerolineae bacterium]
MARSKKQEPAEYGVTFATVQIRPAIKQILKIESSRRAMALGALVAELVIERYGETPEYKRILKEAGLLE